MSINDRIKRLREQQGESQEKFAEKIGIKRSNYAQIERGKQLPTIDTICNIVRNYNVTYDYLIEGKPYKEADMKHYQAAEEESAYGLTELDKLKQKVEDYERVFKLMGINKPDIK